MICSTRPRGVNCTDASFQDVAKVPVVAEVTQPERVTKTDDVAEADNMDGWETAPVKRSNKKGNNKKEPLPKQENKKGKGKEHKSSIDNDKKSSADQGAKNNLSQKAAPIVQVKKSSNESPKNVNSEPVKVEPVEVIKAAVAEIQKPEVQKPKTVEKPVLVKEEPKPVAVVEPKVCSCSHVT